MPIREYFCIKCKQPLKKYRANQWICDNPKCYRYGLVTGIYYVLGEEEEKEDGIKND